jgi:hypothetical protein
MSAKVLNETSNSNGVSGKFIENIGNLSIFKKQSSLLKVLINLLI